MWRKISPTWMLLGLVLAAILIRVAYVWPLPTDSLKWSDEQEYDQIAWRLACTGQYQSNPYRATPVVPWFLAAVYRVAGHNYRAARVAQSVLGGMTVLMVYGIGASLFTRATGYIAALGLTFYPPLIYLSGVFYAEQLFTVLLMATVFCLVKWWQTKRLRWVVVAGIGLGLGALCRPVLLGFVPFAAAYVAWTTKARLRWLGILVLLGVSSATIVPWSVRNEITFGCFVPISTGFGLQLWRGNNDASRGDADDRHLIPGGDLERQRINEMPDSAQRHAAREKERRLAAALPESVILKPSEMGSAAPNPLDLVKFDQVLEHAGVEWMIYHPDSVLWLSGRRMLGLYSALTRTRTQSEDVSRRNQIIAVISFYPVLAMGLIGAVFAWNRQRASVVLHAAIVAGTVVYLLTTACTRYRLPLDPLWILLASVAVTSQWEGLRAAVTSAWDSAWERPGGPSQLQER